MIPSRLLAAAFSVAALLVGPALAQTVPVVTPNTVGPSGTPTTVGKTFIINPDGSVAGIGTSSATAGNPPPSSGTLIMGSDGTAARTVRTDANGILASAVAGTPGNTAPTMGNLMLGTDGTVARTVRTNTAGGLVMEGNVGGTVAAGQADGGNPVKIGGVASSTPPTAVTTGQRVNAYYDPNGRTVVTFADSGGGGVAIRTPVDGAASEGSLSVLGRNTTFDGILSRWNNMRDANSATGTTGTGLQGAGVLGRYNQTLPVSGDGVYAALQTNNRGQLSISAGSNIALGAPTAASPTILLGRDGTIAPLAIAGYLYTGSSNVPMSGDATGSYVIGKGGSSIATNQVSVGTTATLIAAARTGRQKIGVTVTSAVQCAFGGSAVTLATGWPLAAVAYATDNWDTAAALYAVCASTATVGYREQF